GNYNARAQVVDDQVAFSARHAADLVVTGVHHEDTRVRRTVGQRQAARIRAQIVVLNAITRSPGAHDADARRLVARDDVALRRRAADDVAGRVQNEDAVAGVAQDAGSRR